MRIVVQFPTARAEVRDRAWHCPGDLDLERELAQEFGLSDAEELTAEVAAIAAKFGGVVVSVDQGFVPVADEAPEPLPPIGIMEGDGLLLEAPVVAEIEQIDPLARGFEDND